MLVRSSVWCIFTVEVAFFFLTNLVCVCFVFIQYGMCVCGVALRFSNFRFCITTVGMDAVCTRVVWMAYGFELSSLLHHHPNSEFRMSFCCSFVTMHTFQIDIFARKLTLPLLFGKQFSTPHTYANLTNRTKTFTKTKTINYEFKSLQMIKCASFLVFYLLNVQCCFFSLQNKTKIAHYTYTWNQH